ncbi:hypothetical protein T11_8750 [Trichinella zimbabwensis]|uniref:Uncharacterized protein n=1 Tax=Trichinella zimbabwensis TaxID=268475 RepID=A0A0V1I4N0_9BILA|nr:hypothetical protein T11_8750 [Trichinella zimbabwensis]
MTFPNGIVGTFLPENSIAAQCIVTLSTVCPFLFVNSMRAASEIAFIVDPTLSANCYCPRMAGSERAVPILFSHLLKFFLHCRLTGFMYDSLGRGWERAAWPQNGESSRSVEQKTAYLFFLF